MSEKLLPCPFCGCANDHCYKDSERYLWWALCNGCGVRLCRGTKAAAITAWNKRAPSEQAIVEAEMRGALAMREAADILEVYAEYIRSVKACELERHPYLPQVEDVISELRAIIGESHE